MYHTWHQVYVWSYLYVPICKMLASIKCDGKLERSLNELELESLGHCWRRGVLHGGIIVWIYSVAAELSWHPARGYRIEDSISYCRHDHSYWRYWRFVYVPVRHVGCPSLQCSCWMTRIRMDGVGLYFLFFVGWGSDVWCLSRSQFFGVPFVVVIFGRFSRSLVFPAYSTS